MILSHEDADLLKKLGINISFQPRYQAKKLFHKQGKTAVHQELHSSFSVLHSAYSGGIQGEEQGDRIEDGENIAFIILNAGSKGDAKQKY